MISYENTKITKNTLYRTLSDDLDPRNISERGFDLAFSLVDLAGNNYLKDEYFTTKLH
jgi:hypothetical protein